MKNRVALITMLIIASAAGTSAQVILDPAATGDVYYKYTYMFAYRADIPISAFSTFIDFDVATPGIDVGWNYYRYTSGHWSTHYFLQKRSWTKHGVMEFDIGQTASGAPFPIPGMTANNFVAHLEGIVVENGPTGVQLQVNLMDLEDGQEDGAVTESDFDGGQQFIRTLFNSIPPAGTELNPVDVTAQIREDLFGSSASGDTSGFLMSILHPGQDNVFVNLDHSRPQVKIYLTGTPVPTALPTATPASGNVSVQLDISQSIYRPGDRFLLTAAVANFTEEPLADQPFAVVLDAYGSYFWYPGWTDQFQFEPLDLFQGTTEMTILDFTWPEASGSATGIRFLGAVLEQDLSGILGLWDWVQFGWNS